MTGTKSKATEQVQAPAPGVVSTMPDDDEARPIPLSAIQPSALNPRKKFDEGKLAELAASIRSKGLIQPIVVRPIGGPKVTAGSRRYEIVAGERRFRAASLAGLTSIRAIVRSLSDKDVLEIAVIENEQREDVTPMEKAHGYAALIDDHGLTVEDLAARVGKSASTIRGLLNLRRLPAKALKALEAGELSMSVAQLLARVPGAKAREHAVSHALVANYNGDLPTFRDMKRFVEKHCMVELKAAPFPRIELNLVADTPSCDECPKRTGNDPLTYPDARADVCTDPECYATKVEAWKVRVAAEEKAAGRTVLSASECEKIYQRWSDGELAYDAPYVDLDAKCFDDEKRRTYRTLIGRDSLPTIVIAFDRFGHRHELVAKDAAAKALRATGKIKLPKRLARSSLDANRQKEEAARRERADRGRRAALVANGKVAAAVESAFNAFQGRIAVERLRALADSLARSTWHDAVERVAKRRGVTPSKSGHALTATIAAESSCGALLGIIAELIAARASEYWGKDHGYEDAPLFAAFGIDQKQLEKEAVKTKKGGKK